AGQHEPGSYYDIDREGTMRKVPEAGAPKTRAALMVPVKHEGAVVGVVQVMSDCVEYSAEQLELVEGLVGQMAAAVRNARLQKERSPARGGGSRAGRCVRARAGCVRALTSERRLEEEKTDLVATISHELRTPMAAVYGAAETLLGRNDLPPERRRELLAMIAAQATRLTAIVESVLLTSRLDRGDVA